MIQVKDGATLDIHKVNTTLKGGRGLYLLDPEMQIPKETILMRRVPV